MNFSEAMFYENYLTSYFHTNTVISRRVCLLVKMASKTAIRPIARGVARKTALRNSAFTNKGNTKEYTAENKQQKDNNSNQTRKVVYSN